MVFFALRWLVWVSGMENVVHCQVGERVVVVLMQLFGVGGIATSFFRSSMWLCAVMMIIMVVVVVISPQPY